MAAAPLPPFSAPVPGPEPASLSEGARLVNAFIAPSRTFNRSPPQCKLVGTMAADLHPVATNPAYFMDRAGNKFLYVMASGLDVIVIWTIVLMGIGFACNSRVRRTTAIAIVAGWYLFWKLGVAALAAQ